MTKPDSPNRSQPIVYDSAIDSWIALLLFLGPALAAGLGVTFLVDGRAAEASTLFLTAAVTLFVTIALTLPCRYTILEDCLSVRCGIICYQVALKDIRSVEPTATLRSAPALSIRRLMVKTDRRNYVISPHDRDAFQRDLAAAISKIVPSAEQR